MVKITLRFLVFKGEGSVKERGRQRWGIRTGMNNLVQVHLLLTCTWHTAHTRLADAALYRYSVGGSSQNSLIPQN